MFLKQDQTTRKLRQGKIAIIIFIVLTLLAWTYGYYYDHSLRKNLVIVSGTITSIDHPAKHGPQANFTYSIQGKSYIESAALPSFKDYYQASVLLTRSFTVALDSSNIEHAIMLFDSSSFVQYGLRYPDILRWLKNYLD